MRVAVLTTGRQDWGVIRSTCRTLLGDSRFDLRLLVGGMHCSARFGHTIDVLREDGFVPQETLPWVPDDGSAEVQRQAADALWMVADAIGRQRPDALLLVGDRFETAAAALAATLAAIPIVHLHGGEESEGSFDNNFRHSISKLSHLHLVSHTDHRARLIGMGEDPAAVHVVGAPGLDNLRRTDLPGRDELARRLGIDLVPPVVIVTLHPATLGGDAGLEVRAVAQALDDVEATYVLTMPNTDPGQDVIRQVFAAAAARPRRVVVEALGDRAYWGLLQLADVVLGNSSSALIEAPAVQVPAVNIGERQRGRLRGANVIDVVGEPGAIREGLRRALEPAFRASLSGTNSPYGDGRSSERIREILAHWVPPRPPVKRAQMNEHRR